MKASFPKSNSEATANTVVTLRDVLDACRNDRPDAVAYAFIRDDLSLVDSLTRGQLAAQAAEWAARIEQHTALGDRVALVYPAGLDFVRAFWACLLCGRIAVPVSAPDPARFKHSAPRLRAVFEDSQASLVLSTAEMAEAAADLHSKKPRWLVLEKDRAAPQLDSTSSAREPNLGIHWHTARGDDHPCECARPMREPQARRSCRRREPLLPMAAALSRLRTRRRAIAATLCRGNQLPHVPAHLLASAVALVERARPLPHHPHGSAEFRLRRVRARVW